jgi:hypothetical protein
MKTTSYRYDPSRDRLNLIQTWKIMGHLSFIRPVSEQQRVEIFLSTMHQLSRRIKIAADELRWVLKEEGDFTNKLPHFHFLLDGSNMPNKDAAKLASAFGKLWVKVGGGNHDVRPYAIVLDRHGYQRAVNYVTKVEGFCRVPFSPFFNAGENCHLKFSDGLDRHLAVVCRADQTTNQKDNHEREIKRREGREN